jgi:hypothetical protein
MCPLAKHGFTAYLREEVGDNSVTRPLREETNGNQDDQTMAVTRGRPELSPVVALELLLQLNSLSDLIELDVDQFIVFVSLGMHVCQDLLRLLQSALRDEPTGGFGNSPANSRLATLFLVELLSVSRTK